MRSCMASTDNAFELESSGSDTPPVLAPPHSSRASSNGSLTFPSLAAHAAIRFLDVDAGNYDTHDLPVSRSPSKTSSRFSLGQPFRSVRAYLSTKMGPSFQERHICLEGTSFVVRSVLHPGEANERVGGVFMRFPLCRLVDVAAHRVEKDLFVFKMLPPSARQTEEARRVRAESAPNCRSSPPNPTASSHLSPQGDVGMHLVFREQTNGPVIAPSAAAAAREQYRKVEIRFLSSSEREMWLRAMKNVYMEFLLDSIRTGGDGRLSSADVRRLVEESNRLMQDKPPPAVMERHIDFFLSSAGREEIDPPHEAHIVDPSDVPCGGILHIGLGDGQYEARRFAYKLSAKRTESGDRVELEYIVMYPTTVSQRVRMVPKHKVLVSQLRVVVEEEHWGNAFFLEQTARDHSHRESLLGVCQSQLSKFESAFTAPDIATIMEETNENSPHDKNGKSEEGESTSNDFVITEIIELQTNSFPNRIKWLKWFEAVLRKPTVYLSRIREIKEGGAQNGIRRATSLFPETMMPVQPNTDRGGENTDLWKEDE